MADAHPPGEGWAPFGTHLDCPVRLEFCNHDSGGVPEHERVVIPVIRSPWRVYPDGLVEAAETRVRDLRRDLGHAEDELRQIVKQGPEPAISLLREIRDHESVPTYLRAEADQVLDRVYGIQDD